MSKTNFTFEQNRMLTEIYRRLNYFHKGDLNHELLLLGFPSEVKSLIGLGIIKPSYEEVSRAFNWYSLTDNGKSFFNNYIEVVDDTTNHVLFNGIVKIFDKKLLN